jgi:sulfur-oxidizing protein SoxX
LNDVSFSAVKKLQPIKFEEEILMRIKTTILFSLIASLGLASLGYAAEGVTGQADGRSLAFDNKKGNCLACHAIPGDPKTEAAGNIGPPLVNIKQRFPDRAKLRAQIWDATVANPDSVMPPFGRNKILTEEEIDLVTDYVQGL